MLIMKRSFYDFVSEYEEFISGGGLRSRLAAPRLAWPEGRQPGIASRQGWR